MRIRAADVRAVVSESSAPERDLVDVEAGEGEHDEGFDDGEQARDERGTRSPRRGGGARGVDRVRRLGHPVEPSAGRITRLGRDVEMKWVWI